MRLLMLLGGTAVGAVSVLPMPWRLRLRWVKLVQALTRRGTAMIPATLRFAEEQNAVYAMGKQRGQGYRSLIELETILAAIERDGVSVERVREALRRAEAEEVSPEELGPFMARAVLAPRRADRVVREAAAVGSY